MTRRGGEAIDYGYNAEYVGGYVDYLAGAVAANPNLSKMTKEPVSLAKIQAPAETVLFADSTSDAARYPWAFSPGFFPTLQARHLETCNVAFLDGHAKAMKVHIVNNTQQRGYVGRGSTASDEYYNGTGQP